ncbi:MAG: TonB-dependent receptor [Salinivirgaceae bacterium]|nr:TonB-dependent receptor [Salinivirgaceae bacterium]
MKNFLAYFVILFFINSVNAQDLCRVSGTIKDAETGDVLIGANIYIQSLNKGAVTNEKGFYSIKIPCNKYKLTISYLGYNSIAFNVNTEKSLTHNFKLEPTSLQVQDVTISSEKADKNIRSTEVGTIQLDAKDIGKLPTLMGEPDIIAGLRLTPGIQAGGEGNSGLYVRGGDAGQNLILLDNMPLYNPSHLLGFFPAFNADIVDNVKVIKGAMPAYYGGKTSSVFDISMKDGSPDSFKGSGSLGLLSTDLTLESPINKGKGSVIISGRRTYFELIKPVVSKTIKTTKDFFDNTNYYFYDASIKAQYKLSNKDRIYFTAFTGKDEYKLGDEEYKVSNQMSWGNSAAAFRYNRVFSNKLISNITTGFTSYGFNLYGAFDQYSLELNSNIRDYYTNLDFNYLFPSKSTLKFGFQYSNHKIVPNELKADVLDINFNSLLQYLSNEYALYCDAKFNLSENFTISSGVRITSFQHVGPYTKYFEAIPGQAEDSISFNKNEKVATYNMISPNFSFVWMLNNKSSIKGSSSYSHQAIHLASVGSVSLPTDMWIPSTDFVEPQKVGLATLGYFRNFFNNNFETSFEVYYKNLNNQIEFLNGVLDNVDNKKVEGNILQGIGEAYGAEFYIKKQFGKTTGWASYTLSRTWKKFKELGPEKFPAKYDRVHDFSITLNHKLSDKWSISAVFIYATGNAMTLPIGRYFIQGNLGNEYTDVNSFRMPSYHRLDISANYKLKTKGRLESNLNFSVYNVYNRSNPYFIYFRVKGDVDNYYLSVKPRQISLFPILPSITWNFKF